MDLVTAVVSVLLSTKDAGSTSSSFQQHWHGITQHTTTWADGVAFVSQCPIVPGNSFHYSFNPGNQVGTYWYHSHYRAQYCDGLRGVIVIYDPNDPYKSLYDVDDGNDPRSLSILKFTEIDSESTVITLADWYRYPAPQVQPGLGHVALVVFYVSFSSN